MFQNPHSINYICAREHSKDDTENFNNFQTYKVAETLKKDKQKLEECMLNMIRKEEKAKKMIKNLRSKLQFIADHYLLLEKTDCKVKN